MRIFITKENFVLPFNMVLNVDASDIPYSTEVTESVASLPGVDGEIQTDCRYAAQTHTLVLRSWPGITEDEKNALYSEMNRFLVAAKSTDQEIRYERLGRTYYVRLVGRPDKPNEYADWIEFTLPLKAHDPFGYQDGELRLVGLGAITNRGNVHTPARIEFMGPVNNPSVTVDGTLYKYSGNVSSGYTLRVDSKRMRAELVEISTEAATNVNINWNGNFLVLQPGTIEVNNIENALDKTVIFWRNRWA